MDISLKISDLTDAQANTFVSRFLKNYFKAGFLALGKRDLELLLYYELEIAGVIDRDADNYSVATMLRVTPNRVASIRRDAYARWAKESDRKELLAMGLRRALSEDGIQGALDSISNAKLAGGFIPLLLEHPTQRGAKSGLLPRLLDGLAYLAHVTVRLHYQHVNVDEPPRVLDGPDEHAAVAERQPVPLVDALEELGLELGLAARAVEDRRHDVDLPRLREWPKVEVAIVERYQLLEREREPDVPSLVHALLRFAHDLGQ